MADPTYQPKVYRTTGGDKQVVASGGEIKMEPGSTLTADGTQASKISDPSGGGTVDAEARTAINAIIDALEGINASASV